MIQPETIDVEMGLREHAGYWAKSETLSLVPGPGKRGVAGLSSGWQTCFIS